MQLSKAQDAIEEIGIICQKYGIALIGRNSTDGTHCELQIIETNDLDLGEIEHLSSGDKPYKHNGLTLVNGIT